MNWLKDYRIERTPEGDAVLVIFINESDTEFADEHGCLKKEKEKDLIASIQAFIERQLPDLRVKGVKIVLGGLLLAALPLSGAYASESSYTIQPGDTLWKIAETYKTTVANLKELNGLTSDMIYSYESLIVPGTTNDVNGEIYQVKAGDTLYKIAKAYGTTVAQIKASNQLTSDNIYIGQTLTVKSGSETTNSYQVVSGDSLWRIANQYNTTVDNLKSLNQLTSDQIYPGQVLMIPSEATTSESEAPYVTYVSHTVESGENIWQIAIDYGIPSDEVLEANQLSSSDSLSVGQVLQIPVHHIPVKSTVSANHGELLDWWTEAQYVFATGDVAEVIDMETGLTFKIQRTTGAFHADSEPLTAEDTAIAQSIWGGYSWETRPVLISIDGRKIAASMSFMPHDVAYISDNNFDGHFDVHFLNSTRHKDNQIDEYHQESVKIAAGVISS